jgi:hypothetical protein
MGMAGMMPRIFPHVRRRRFVCLFLCSLISIGAWATESANSEASAGQAHTDNSARTLRTFEAIYKTSALGMTLDLTRSLTQDGATYTLTSRGKNMLINMNESADFRIEQGKIEGIRFDSKVKSLKTNKRAVRFDESAGVINSMKRGDWTQHPWEPDILDRFSQQQQLRLTLIGAAEPPETLEFRVVDGPKVSDKRWQRLPNEVIDTPLGQISTVKYRAVHTNPDKRASEIWLAPELDYLMVKTIHVERSSTVKVAIKSLNWLDGA